jgi:phage gpG-like protein
MAGGVVKFRIQWAVSSAHVARVFDAFGEDLRDWSPAMIRVRLILAEMFRSIFASNGTALGAQADVGVGVADVSSGWAPESVETLHRKMRSGNSSATLHLTGVLEASLTNAEGTTGSIRKISAGRDGLPTVLFGTRLPYAAPNNFGSRKHGLPARPFMGITDEAREAIVDSLNAHLRDRLAAAAAALNERGAS